MAVVTAERIEVLRSRVRTRKSLWHKSAGRARMVIKARSLRDSAGISSWQIRRGLVTRDRLASVRFELDDLELLAGRLSPRQTEVPDSEYEDARKFMAGYPVPRGQTGHCELDVERVMAEGIDGVSRSIRKRMDGASPEAADAYQSFLFALEGLSAMIENAATAAGRAMPGASPERLEELRDIGDSCRHIAHGAPRSFRDAIQLLWLITFGVMFGEDVGLVVPGHLDRTLYPFYTGDAPAGETLELIESLYLLINEYIPDGLAMSAMVGGRNAEGNDVTNELSYLCVEALRRTRLIYPSVGICWHEGTPQDLVELGVEIIGAGNPNPVFFGDETIQSGLKALGTPPDEACHYTSSTCVEITPARGSNVWVASPYFSTCKILLEEIRAQAETTDPAMDFEGFKRAYFARFAERMARAVAHENESRKIRKEHGRKPLQSAFTRDCIARGRDIDDGGALYNWVECSFVGLANLTDSLYVIRQEVFEKGDLTFGELSEILENNFEGREDVRRRFSDSYPKYGQDCPEVDAQFGEIVETLREECTRHRIEPDGSPFVPGAFCWIMHERLGRECGATPDGRRAGFPFADGCGPAQGREKNGPTSAILSTTSWDHSPMIGGLAFNMKFTPKLFESKKGLTALRDLVLTFLERGGFETQVNVVDTDTLRKARENPEGYEDLMVRVAGYSDYFTRLSPEMQAEIILRTEFEHV